MDILDIFWTFLLKPPQPFIGLFFEYLTAGLYAGLLSANFPDVKKNFQPFEF